MELETVVRGFFKPELFLDYVRHCVLFEQNDVGIIKRLRATTSSMPRAKQYVPP